MKTTRNISINIDLLRRVTDKIPLGGFSALVESLLEKWDKKTPERIPVKK